METPTNNEMMQALPRGSGMRLIQERTEKGTLLMTAEAWGCAAQMHCRPGDEIATIGALVKLVDDAYEKSEGL